MLIVCAEAPLWCCALAEDTHPSCRGVSHCVDRRRNDELERQMLEITTSFKARLAEAEGERERDAAIAKKERRLLAKELRLAKEENAALERRLLAAGTVSGIANDATLPLPATVDAGLARQGDF
jgi:hypothetical protein